MTYFDNDNVTTSVDIGIPDEMWFRVKNFEVGDEGFFGLLAWLLSFANYGRFD